MFHMDLRLLRSFAAIADERSVTRASELLHLTQPTISGHLKELETELGFKLFHRTTRTITLTTEGEHLLPLVHDTLARSEALRMAVENMNIMRSTRFRLGAALYTIDFAERSELLDAFAEAAPQIHFTIDNRLQSAQVPDLVAGNLDASLLLGIAVPSHDHGSSKPEEAIVIYNESEYSDNLTRVVLRREYIRLLVPNNSPLAQFDLVPRSYLQGQRVAMLGQDHGHSLIDPIGKFIEDCDGIPEWLSDGNAWAVERHAKRHAICGIGVGWYPVLDGLVEREVEGMDFFTELSVVLGQGANRAARQFFDFAATWQILRAGAGKTGAR